MDVTNSGAPIASSDGDEVEFGVNKSTLNGNLDFLGNLDTNTDMASSVTDSDD